jgi:hypothetical protein
MIPKNNDELKVVKSISRKKAEERIERIFLTELLSHTGGNISKAAQQAKLIDHGCRN